MLKDAMARLQFGSQTSEETDFLILEDLPFDFILGHETCRTWNGILNWKDATFSIIPEEETTRVEMEWNVYRGQHWRSPVRCVTHVEATIKPGEQRILSVTHSEGEFEGLVERGGLITPIRDLATMSNKFGVAYAYSEGVDKVLVMNLSMNEIKIKKGTTVAEFHPRPLSNLILLRQETSCTSEPRSEGSRHLKVRGPSNTSNDYQKTESRGKSHLSDESMSEEGRDTGSEVRMLQHKREQLAYLSCVAQTESTGGGASTTSAPQVFAGQGPIKEDDISMGFKGFQVTDEVVVADWTKEPLTQIDLSHSETIAVGRGEGTHTGVSSTFAPHESKGQRPNKEDNISMGTRRSQVTDEVVAADWKKEPLTQIDVSPSEGTRSKNEIKKLMRVIWEYRHLLSDGHLDFTKISAPTHPTVCRIATSVEDPHIQATNRSVSPADLELGRNLIRAVERRDY